MRIIRGTPSRHAEINGEDQACCYDEPNGKPAHVSLPGRNHPVLFEAFFSESGNYALFVNPPGATGAGTGLVLGGRTRDGWFLGGGTEYAITQLPGLFWKSEYRYSDFGSKTDAPSRSYEQAVMT